MDRRTFVQSSGAALAIGQFGAAAGLAPGIVSAQGLPGQSATWINSEPIRLGWFQIRAADAELDPSAVVTDALDHSLNAIMMTAGGNYAFYPTMIPLHERSPSLRDGADFYGGVAAAAKQNNMKMGARFDFSRQSPAALAVHPEWFMRGADGMPFSEEPGSYRPCMNTDFYATQGIAVIGEVLNRYRPDLIYINNFVNPAICYCPTCERGYRARYGKAMPAQADAEYLAFRQEFYDRAADLITRTVHDAWPGVLVINADSFRADGWHTETRTRAYPTDFWLYSSSELVNRQRNSHPEKAAINVIVGYSTNFSRLVVMPQDEMKVQAYQAISHGSPLTYALTGTTMRQANQMDLAGMREVYEWHKTHSDLYGLQISEARVLMLVEPETSPRHRRLSVSHSARGLYRMLTEAHIPVAVCENTRALAERRFDLVIVTNGAPTDGLQNFVEQGGRALFINCESPFGLPPVLGVHAENAYAYVEIRDPTAFPSSRGVTFITAAGGFATQRFGSHGLPAAAGGEMSISEFYIYPDEPDSSLTFVPPMMENPSEFAFMDQRQTATPGLITRAVGNGRVACVPWDLGGFYTRNGLPIHLNLFADIVDSMLPEQRQIRTSAHPSVEMALMRQPQQNRTVLHLINASGQSQNGYFKPIDFQAIDIELAGLFASATARAANRRLPVRRRNGRTRFVLPTLGAYEAIVLR